MSTFTNERIFYGQLTFNKDNLDMKSQVQDTRIDMNNKYLNLTEEETKERNDWVLSLFTYGKILVLGMDRCPRRIEGIIISASYNELLEEIEYYLIQPRILVKKRNGKNKIILGDDVTRIEEDDYNKYTDNYKEYTEKNKDCHCFPKDLMNPGLCKGCVLNREQHEKKRLFRYVDNSAYKYNVIKRSFPFSHAYYLSFHNFDENYDYDEFEFDPWTYESRVRDWNI